MSQENVKGSHLKGTQDVPSTSSPIPNLAPQAILFVEGRAGNLETVDIHFPISAAYIPPTIIVTSIL